MIGRRNIWERQQDFLSLVGDEANIMPVWVSKNRLVHDKAVCYNGFGLSTHVGRQGLRVVPPRRRTRAEEVLRMDNVTLFGLILAVAGLVFAAYIAGTQNRR